MRHRLFFHLVWTTRERAPVIQAPTADFLVRFARQAVFRAHGSLMEIGIVATHVHLLVRLGPSASLPELLQRLKGGSAYLINQNGLSSTSPFRWAPGYSIDTVSRLQLERVGAYLRGQPERHPAERIPDWLGPRDRTGDAARTPASPSGLSGRFSDRPSRRFSA